MSRSARVELAGLTYHVFCRGVRRSAVFRGEDDYLAFIWDLRKLSREHGVSIFSFCLMPNHPHLGLRTDGDPLCVFMQRLNLRHARRFNRAYSVIGHLNEARYQARVVDDTSYLLTLVRYIHQNPVRAGLCATVDGWPYSSHQAYVRKRYRWIDTEQVLRLTGGCAGYRQLMGQDLGAEDLQSIRALGMPGDAGSASARTNGPIDRRAALPNPWTRPEPDAPIEDAARPLLAALRLELVALTRADARVRHRLARQRFVQGLRSAGYSLRAIGELLGRGEATICRIARPPPSDPLG